MIVTYIQLLDGTGPTRISSTSSSPSSRVGLDGADPPRARMKYVFPYASTLVGLWIDDVIEDMELGRCLSGSSMLERMLEFGLSTSSAEEVDSATEDASEGHEWTLVPRLGARKEIPTIRGGGAVG